MKSVLLCACFAFALLTSPAFAQSSSATSSSQEAKDPLADIKKQQEKLQAENNLADQQLKKSLADLQAEKQRLDLENQLAQSKLNARLAVLQAEIDELTKKNDLAQKRGLARDAEKKAALDADLAAAKDRLERLKVSNDLATQEAAVRTRDIQNRQQDLQLKTMELQAQRAENEAALAKLNLELDLQDRKDKIKNRVKAEPVYTSEPYKAGVLTISDRRIPFNGVVTMDLADDIVERINYYNNQNPVYPIFIVIDSSPGGSVMAGYKILKAMEGSSAPVYVVVKSFAASMAAGITTLAKKSYAYPNAIILHHQILTFSFGNLTEQRESVQELEKWWKRLAEPVAAKMGITLDEFIKRMYKNRSTGDWMEFGDEAKKIKWVDEVVDQIREQSIVKNPDSVEGPIKPRNPWFIEQKDGNGKAYVPLPRLDPVDAWYLYNPDGYFRAR